MQFKLAVVCLAAFFGMIVAAYENNCEGSFISPDVDQCITAIDAIEEDKIYYGGEDFSYESCEVKYKTSSWPTRYGSMLQPSESIKGSYIKDAAYQILAQCEK
ncbi:hypothetical protein LTR37_006148 [Vermiconidia calcicola]|uniref:Uncharacterized protein n=1 Tax=Vermiconidia calcicola TaxID=1690605 RepID=A0ACC3NIK3_9PEZI|nr:hypothetical protein LTR37_006148 [Vermiconidia calcicola]